MWVALENNRICQLDSIWFTFVNEKKGNSFHSFVNVQWPLLLKNAKKSAFVLENLNSEQSSNMNSENFWYDKCLRCKKENPSPLIHLLLLA